MPDPQYPPWLIERQVIALFLETTGNGIFTTLAFMATYMLIVKKGKAKSEWYMLGATVSMWAIATAHLHMRMWSLILAIRGDLFELVPLVYVVSNVYEGVRLYLPAINMVLGDAIVVWRVWAIWGRNIRICIMPLFLLFCTFVTALTAVIIYFSTKSLIVEANSVYTTQMMLFAFCGATNLYSTAAIGYKAWSHGRMLKTAFANERRSHLSRPFALAIESGGLYCLTWIVVLILAVNSVKIGGRDALFLDVLVQLTGIYPTLIVVLVLLKRTFNDTLDRSTGGAVSLSSTKLGSSYQSRDRRLKGTTPIEVDIEHEQYGSSLQDLSNPELGRRKDGQDMHKNGSLDEI